MKNKKLFLTALLTVAVTFLICIGIGFFVLAKKSSVIAHGILLRNVSQEISATGSIHSQQEAVLHFQTGGKLVYLPFKKGDTVYAGQTIAQLDTYALQKELAAALNTYRSTRDSFDQTQANSQNNVLFGQQRYNIEVFSKSGITTGDSENNIISDMIKRIIDENQAGLDNSVINVELANDALQLATLTAPFNGVMLQEDVTTPNVNVTPMTSFTLADPSEKIFRAEVAASDIDFVSVGAQSIIRLDGQTTTLPGHVIAVYPQKQTLPDGEQVYEVDIQADGLSAFAFGQNGSVLIASNAKTQALMVPTWTIVGNTKLWVWDGKRAVLKTITIGATHGSMTEVVSGLAPHDEVITVPKSLLVHSYQIL